MLKYFKIKRNSILIGSFLFLTFAQCTGKRSAGLPYYDRADFTPQWIENQEDVSKKIKHRIADFSFENQSGKKITEKNLVRKIHIANFFFTTCGSICPRMTENLKKVQNNFKNDADILLLSYSVMPWIDSIPRLRGYAERESITTDQWHLLTGDKYKIYQLARQSYFAEEEFGFTKDSTDFLHTERVLLIDKNRRIRGVYNGTVALDMNRLIADIELLKQE
jgi:protein SCO1/2